MEEKRQEILQYIRFNMPGIEKKILEEKRKNLDLFEEDNELELREEKSEWDEEYIDFLLVKTRKNFSERKLNHLIKVRNYIRGEIKEVPKNEENIKRREPRREELKLKEIGKKIGKKVKKVSLKFIKNSNKKEIEEANEVKKEKFDKK